MASEVGEIETCKTSHTILSVSGHHGFFSLEQRCPISGLWLGCVSTDFRSLVVMIRDDFCKGCTCKTRCDDRALDVSNHERFESRIASDSKSPADRIARFEIYLKLSEKSQSLNSVSNGFRPCDSNRCEPVAIRIAANRDSRRLRTALETCLERPLQTNYYKRTTNSGTAERLR